MSKIHITYLSFVTYGKFLICTNDVGRPLARDSSVVNKHHSKCSTLVVKVVKDSGADILGSTSSTHCCIGQQGLGFI